MICKRCHSERHLRNTKRSAVQVHVFPIPISFAKTWLLARLQEVLLRMAKAKKSVHTAQVLYHRVEEVPSFAFCAPRSHSPDPLILGRAYSAKPAPRKCDYRIERGVVSPPVPRFCVPSARG